jgi:hypothetical protein
VAALTHLLSYTFDEIYKIPKPSDSQKNQQNYSSYTKGDNYDKTFKIWRQDCTHSYEGVQKSQEKECGAKDKKSLAPHKQILSQL